MNMQDLTIVQIGFKPAKKSDQNRTVYLKDSKNYFFETNTGLGMDLSAKLALQWFGAVVQSMPQIMEKISSIANNKNHKHYAIAQDMQLEEGGKDFKRGLALSFNTLVYNLQALGVIEQTNQMLSNHEDISIGNIYVIRFLD